MSQQSKARRRYSLAREKLEPRADTQHSDQSDLHREDQT